MAATKIEWVRNLDGGPGNTWNPITGCTKVSSGCAHCFAERRSARNLSMGCVKYDGVVGDDRKWSGKVRCHGDVLNEPLRWRKPRTVFVCSMSDLFHPAVPSEFIDTVFAVMALCPQHTFQVLTKRPERMVEYLVRVADCGDEDVVLGDTHIGNVINGLSGSLLSEVRDKPGGNERWRWIKPEYSYEHGHNTDAIAVPGYWEYDEYPLPTLISWPLPNIWLGTSVEDQKTADERIPHLLRCPAAVRFLSCEPLLEPIDTGLLDALGIIGALGVDAGGGEWGPEFMRDGTKTSRVDWVIVGGESGPKARPMDLAWARSIRDQCKAAGVPFFCKQMSQRSYSGHWRPNYKRFEMFPPDLQIREWPNADDT